MMNCKHGLLLGIVSSFGVVNASADTPENHSAILLTKGGRLLEANVASREIVQISVPGVIGSGPEFNDVRQLLQYGADGLLALKPFGIVHVDLITGDRTQWVADDVAPLAMNWYALGPDSTLYGFYDGGVVTINKVTGERTAKVVISKNFKTGVVDSAGTVWATSHAIGIGSFGVQHKISLHRMAIQDGGIAETWDVMSEVYPRSPIRTFHHTGMVADGSGHVQAAFFLSDPYQPTPKFPWDYTFESRIVANDRLGYVVFPYEAIVGFGISAADDNLMVSQDGTVWDRGISFELELEERITCAIFVPARHTNLSGFAALQARQVVLLEQEKDDLNNDQIVDAADVVTRRLATKVLVGE